MHQLALEEACDGVRRVKCSAWARTRCAPCEVRAHVVQQRMYRNLCAVCKAPLHESAVHGARYMRKRQGLTVHCAGGMFCFFAPWPPEFTHELELSRIQIYASFGTFKPKTSACHRVPQHQTTRPRPACHLRLMFFGGFFLLVSTSELCDVTITNYVFDCPCEEAIVEVVQCSKLTLVSSWPNFGARLPLDKKFHLFTSSSTSCHGNQIQQDGYHATRCQRQLPSTRR